MEPLVSIVIPTYNRARDLDRALRSVIRQTFDRWEVLVVDKHSTDDTDEVVRRLGDPRIRLHKVQNEGVIANSRNVGIALARGEYVAFLDSDDWWKPNKLAESLEVLEQGSDVVYHDLHLVTKANQWLLLRRARTRPLTRPVFEDLIANGNALTTSSVVMRRSVLKAIHGFSEEQPLIGYEDYDAWLRAAKVTQRFQRIPRTLGFYWAGGGNISNADRTLGLLEVIQSRHADAFRAVAGDGEVNWITYTRGRAHYRLGAFAKARASLRRVGWRRAQLSVVAKGLFTLLMIRLFHGTDA